MNIAAIENNFERIRAAQLPVWLLSRGVSSVTTAEIAALLGIPIRHVSARLASLRERGEIVSPANGLWLPVPPEYVGWGAPPPSEYMDTLMRHFNADYYVGWLSAAELHGASHHAPQMFQVASSRAIRERKVGRSLVRFYHRSHVSSLPTEFRETRSGGVAISTREVTVLDIANDPAISGGIDNVANILIELCEDQSLDSNALYEAAAFYPAAAIRRVGWLIEGFADWIDAGPLHDVLESRSAAPSLLVPSSAERGSLDRRWNLYINRVMEPDV
jgi:predicted transcriptional regulator of viral defense system